MNRHLNTRNTRLSILTFLLGLFITGSTLLTPATELLANNTSADTSETHVLIRDPDHG